MAKINLFSDEWVEMVFEEKNHEYGAYALRKKTPKNHFLALIISCAVFSIAVSAPVIFKAIMPKAKEKNVEVTNLANLKMDKVVAPPKMDEPPPVKNTIKFTPPVVKPDEEVKNDDEMMSQDELSKSTLPISTDNDTVDLKSLDDGPKIVEQTIKPYTFVEQMPEFQGGEEELMKFLKNNISYPQMAKESGIQGTVYVTFVVTPAGKVTKAEILRGIGGGCDEEALRVVKAMPKWNEGRQGNAPVRVQMVLPIRFVLE